MKGLALLFLPIIGLLLFLAGWLLPSHYHAIRYLLMIPGVLVVLCFYFITFADLIKHFPRESPVKIFWLVAIVCAPVVGNVIYVLFREMANRRQQPHGIW